MIIVLIYSCSFFKKEKIKSKNSEYTEILNNYNKTVSDSSMHYFWNGKINFIDYYDSNNVLKSTKIFNNEEKIIQFVIFNNNHILKSYYFNDGYIYKISESINESNEYKDWFINLNGDTTDVIYYNDTSKLNEEIIIGRPPNPHFMNT